MIVCNVGLGYITKIKKKKKQYKHLRSTFLHLCLHYMLWANLSIWEIKKKKQTNINCQLQFHAERKDWRQVNPVCFFSSS